MTLFDELEAPTPAKPVKNEGQQKAYDEILNFLTGNDPSHVMWLLKGYAGTGKTFTLTDIISELDRRKRIGLGDYRIAMSAPTHKAVRVMKKFSTLPPDAVYYATLHSLLGLRAEVDEHGRERFVESKDPHETRIEEFNTLVLDESSMTPDELFIMLLKYVRKGLRILFVGDPVQIPPVNHLDSIPFKPDSVERYGLGVSELTVVMRQAGENPILRLATAIRMGYKTVPHFQIETDTISSVGGGLKGIDRIAADDDTKVESVIKEYFCNPAFEADPDFMKVIAWTNKTVDNFNRMIRKRIYAAELVARTTLPFIMPREKLIMDKPLILPTGRILLTTNEEIEVVNYEIKDGQIDYQTAERNGSDWGMVGRKTVLRHYNTIVNYFDPYGKKVQANIRILHEDENANMRQITEGIANAAKALPPGNAMKRVLWRGFYDVQRLFAQVKYNYAITAHKSQGSTYENAMVLDWDIAMNKKVEERNRIRYVAITRARNLVFIQK